MSQLIRRFPIPRELAGVAGLAMIIWGLFAAKLRSERAELGGRSSYAPYSLRRVLWILFGLSCLLSSLKIDFPVSHPLSGSERTNLFMAILAMIGGIGAILSAWTGRRLWDGRPRPSEVMGPMETSERFLAVVVGIVLVCAAFALFYK